MILGPFSDGEGSWRAFECCRAIHRAWRRCTRQPPRIAWGLDVGANQGAQPPLAGFEARRDGHIRPRRTSFGATRPGARPTGRCVGDRLMRARVHEENFKTLEHRSGRTLGLRQRAMTASRFDLHRQCMLENRQRNERANDESNRLSGCRLSHEWCVRDCRNGNIARK